MNSFTNSLELLENAVTDGICPSAAIAIGVRDEAPVTAVYGWACTEGEQTAATEETLYDMASLTKILSTSIVAFRLIEAGQLRLSDQLGSYFKTDTCKSVITLHQLMTHTSGLLPSIMLPDICKSAEEAIPTILATKLISAPGTQVNYSCLGFILLGKICEQAGGAPLDALAKDLVFTPLGMKHTGYHPTGNNIASTEALPNGHCLKGIVHDENARFLGGISGNAGVFSSLPDCCRFAAMLACGGNSFLSSAMLHTATYNHTPHMAESRGLGFQLPTPGSFCGDLFPPESYGHTGFTGTSLLVDPTSGLWVVLLTNRVHPTRENTRLIRFRSLLHNSIMAEFTR